ncbi:hypothetical protein ALC53_02887 [Atta colombica]|uniref:Uncharacterized protein n=1 Tax=Atta colombica TaxID=520822 RepID=A0A195BR16_9HYME|nr:hypothetical protein ALC53_02887 [Atta colombica]
MFSEPRREDGLKDLRGKEKKRRGAQLLTFRRNFLTVLLCPEEQPLALGLKFIVT